MAKIALIFGLIFCLYVSFCSAECGKLLGSEVGAADIKNIINKHNSLRALITQGKVKGQPKAKNLKDLKWDAQLAKEAQRIANTCVFEHERVKDSRFYVGQNLGWTASTRKAKGANWNSVIQSWFDEQKVFVYPSTSNGVTGHYTQVIWADTNLIGCGYTWYIRPKQIWYEKLYVCNYGPGGNIVGQPPYAKE